MVKGTDHFGRIAGLVQARASSARLPRKVLRPVNGRPMLGYLLDRLRHVDGLDAIMIATSDQASDDAVAALAAEEGIACHRGSLSDVAARLLGAAEVAGAKAFVRVSGDSPLLDPAIITEAVAIFRRDRPDIVSNVLRRTFPEGQSVEVVDTETFRRNLCKFETADDREHVTPYFYRHRDHFRIIGFERQPPLRNLRLSVDVEEDFLRFERLLAQMQRPHWTYGLDDILGLIAASKGLPA